MPPKRRGAPPGNTNALKHGFYARSFKTVELKGLQHTAPTRLTDEIEMLRVFISRLVELSGDITDIDQAMNLLRVLSLATSSLTRLIRAQYIVAPVVNPSTEILPQALTKIIEEFGLT